MHRLFNGIGKVDGQYHLGRILLCAHHTENTDKSRIVTKSLYLRFTCRRLHAMSAECPYHGLGTLDRHHFKSRRLWAFAKLLLQLMMALSVRLWIFERSRSRCDSCKFCWHAKYRNVTGNAEANVWRHTERIERRDDGFYWFCRFSCDFGLLSSSSVLCFVCCCSGGAFLH